MQRAFIIVVLQIDASAQSDQVLQGSDVALTAGVVERGAPSAVLLVQQLGQTHLTAVLEYSYTLK